MIEMSFFQNYKNSSFIGLCLIAYSALFILTPKFHLNIDYVINSNQIDIRLLVMFLLAEPHFAMTLPLLYGYRSNFTERPIKYVLIPLLIVLFGSLLFFKMNSIFLFLFLFANVFHVNRQSVGFFMLQGRFPVSLKFIYEISLHIFTLVCIYFAMILQHHSIIVGLMIFLLTISIVLVVFRIKSGLLPTIKEASIIIQGYLIFLPIVIFSDILLAFAIGISIHYLQYLSVSWRVCKFGFLFSMRTVLFLLIFYSIISTAALSGFLTLERVSIFILLPTIMQLLHFYYDSLIWRRKDGGELVSSILRKAL